MRYGDIDANTLSGPLNGVTLTTGGLSSSFLNASGGYSTPQGEVPAARTLTAGGGLSGGGNLSANRTFNVGANGDGSITVNADDIQVGQLASDTQHGARGGGSQHADAVASGASGFFSGADKALLNGLVSGSPFLQLSGGTMSGNILMLSAFQITFQGGSGNNFIKGNIANSGRLAMFTESQERLSILLGGQVGINKTNPSKQFEVNGEVAFSRIFTSGIKSGATQGGAGAAATEIWKTAGHATLPNNVLLIGV